MFKKKIFLSIYYIFFFKLTLMVIWLYPIGIIIQAHLILSYLRMLAHNINFPGKMVFQQIFSNQIFFHPSPGIMIWTNPTFLSHD